MGFHEHAFPVVGIKRSFVKKIQQRELISYCYTNKANTHTDNQAHKRDTSKENLRIKRGENQQDNNNTRSSDRARSVPALRALFTRDCSLLFLSTLKK